jgi:hypothetical protein
VDLFADPLLQELDRVFAHAAVPWRLRRLVIINAGIPEKMHAPIPTESPSPGKPILPKLHRADGNRRFKEHILILKEILFS